MVNSETIQHQDGLAQRFIQPGMVERAEVIGSPTFGTALSVIKQLQIPECSA